MKIGKIDLDKKVLIVAEIGNNHEGDFELAKKLIYKAKESGADAVKFQTFKAEKFVTITEKERYNQLKSFELSYEQFGELCSIANKNGLLFLSTPFDIESVDALDSFVPAFKISSGDNTFWPLIERVASKGKPVILSTGIANEEEIREVLRLLKKYGKPDPIENWVTLLHCVSSYPVPQEEVNLLSIKYLMDKFELSVGYSDHSLGITACLAAVALGARLIEKHFTYRKENQKFKDHLLSADPKEFKEMVKNIRLIETYLGDYRKSTALCEKDSNVFVRRSIAANRKIYEGEKISAQKLTWLRPATGYKVGEEDKLIGKKALRDIEAGEIIQRSDVK